MMKCTLVTIIVFSLLNHITIYSMSSLGKTASRPHVKRVKPVGSSSTSLSKPVLQKSTGREPLTTTQERGLHTLVKVRKARALEKQRSNVSLKETTQEREPLVTTQKRTLYTPEKLKGLYSPLTVNTKLLSPVFGAAKYESGSIQRMYDIKDSTVPAVQLVQELFNKVGPQFRPTNLKSSAAYSLTPSILGLIIGALETDQLQKPEVWNAISERWRSEHKKITNGDKLTQERLKKLLTLIANTYKEDSQAARTILLSFLYAKAEPTNDHDMMHYFVSLNEYMPLFASQDQAQSSTTPTTVESFFETKKEYTPSEYRTIRQKVNQLSPKQREEYALGEGFEEVMSTIINKKKGSSPYPPQVVMESYGYKEQAPITDCVETAIRDFFNVLIYDPKTSSFDLSLLPKTVHPIDGFKKFYETFNKNNSVNTRPAGQAFMDLVSDVPDVEYNRGNYELMPSAYNFVKIVDHLLGIRAQNIDELGTLLSDERRTVTCQSDESGAKISITIQDTQNPESNPEKQMVLRFTSSHGELIVPERKAANVVRGLLNADELLKQDIRLTPQAESLLSMQLNISNMPRGVLPPSLYYAIAVESDEAKRNLVGTLIHRNLIHQVSFGKQADIKANEEALDYAYHLYTQLEPDSKWSLYSSILNELLQRTHKKFRNVYKLIPLRSSHDEQKMFTSILNNYDINNTEAFDYAYDLLEKLNKEDPLWRIALGVDIVRSDIWTENEKFQNYFLAQNVYEMVDLAASARRLTPIFVDKLYPLLSPEKKNHLLLAVVKQYAVDYGYKTTEVSDLDKIIKSLLSLGVDSTVVDQDGYTALKIVTELRQKIMAMRDEASTHGRKWTLESDKDIPQIDSIIQLLQDETNKQTQLQPQIEPAAQVPDINVITTVKSPDSEKTEEPIAAVQPVPANLYEQSQTESVASEKPSTLSTAAPEKAPRATPKRAPSNNSIFGTVKSWFDKLAGYFRSFF